MAMNISLKQLGVKGGKCLEHLCAFSAIREKQGALYEDKVPATERAKLEGLQSINRARNGSLTPKGSGAALSLTRPALGLSRA